MDNPKTIADMKAIVNRATINRPDLVEKLNQAVGFDVRWHRLDLIKAAMVWYAWQAILGDGRAALVLETMRGAEVEARLKTDPQEIERLRKRDQEYEQVSSLVMAATDGWHTDSIFQAVSTIIQERNLLAEKIKERA